MSLSNSSGVNLQETNSSRLDHILPYLDCIMTPPLSVSATLLFFITGEVERKTEKVQYYKYKWKKLYEKE